MKITLPFLLPTRTGLIARVAPIFVLSSVLVSATAHASERWATLEAIHQIENPHDSSEPGPCGELGAYQFRENTWRMYTMAPFRRALDRQVSDAIAVKHYEWIKSELESRGMRVTPYTVALAWNGGIRAALDGNPAQSTLDYAARAANIASVLQSRDVAYAR